MFAPQRIAYQFRKFIIPALPHDVTTIYRPEVAEYVPPNAKCLLPAVAMGAVSAVTEWSDANILLTQGLAGLGLFYYGLRVAADSLEVRQIDAAHDFSKLYFYFNGGWMANQLFNRINHEVTPDIKYDRETGVLEIPNKSVSVGSFNKNRNTDYKGMYFKLDIYNSSLTLPVGPLDL